MVSIYIVKVCRKTIVPLKVIIDLKLDRVEKINNGQLKDIAKLVWDIRY